MYFSEYRGMSLAAYFPDRMARIWGILSERSQINYVFGKSFFHISSTASRRFTAFDLILMPLVFWPMDLVLTILILLSVYGYSVDEYIRSLDVWQGLSGLAEVVVRLYIQSD